jgi:hypothetical protein
VVLKERAFKNGYFLFCGMAFSESMPPYRFGTFGFSGNQ